MCELWACAQKPADVTKALFGNIVMHDLTPAGSRAHVCCELRASDLNDCWEGVSGPHHSKQAAG